MKNARLSGIFLFIVLYLLVIYSCSTQDESENRSETPESFTVRYEILGTGEVPKIMYTTNDGTVEVEWDDDEGSWDVSGVRLPFIKEIHYITEIDGEVGANGYVTSGCKRISISAYANSNKGRIDKMNIYIDGVLKDSKTSGNYYVPGQHWTPWGTASFQYLRRGGDSNKFKCN